MPPLTVAAIVETPHPISDATLALCRTLGVARHLPAATPRSLTFELHDAPVALANALRRTLHSEISILALTFDAKDLRTDDVYIIPHELTLRLGLIPIRQVTGTRYTLDARNDTDVTAPVFSSQLREVGEKSPDEMMAGGFVLTYLRPGKRLTISKIYAVDGVAYKDGARFSLPGKMSYSTPPDRPAPSSLAPPTRQTILMAVPRQKYFDPRHAIKTAALTIASKLAAISRALTDAPVDYYSSDIEAVYTAGSATYKLIGETVTIGNLLCAYGYEADPSIGNISCARHHPSFPYVVVSVSHSDPRGIMAAAIKAALSDLKTVVAAF